MSARWLVFAVLVALLNVLALAGTPALASAPPEVYVTNVSGSSATLHAVLDPEGVATSYRFEYGTSTAYGSETPEREAGFGVSATPVEFHVQDLNAATVYHYRVLATNAAHETSASADETFTTQTSGTAFALPDGREWELVSPPSKHGALIESDEGNDLADGGVTKAATAGDALTYVASSPTEVQPQGNAEETQVLATRGLDGWQSRDISIAHEEATGASVGWGSEYRFFSEDLLVSFVQPYAGFIPASSPYALSAEASEQTGFVRTDFVGGDVEDPCTNSCFRPLVTGAPGYANVPPGTEFGEEGRCPPEQLCGPYVQGISPDGAHVVLYSAAQLTETETPGGGLYEWAAGKLTLVSVLPASEGGGAANLPNLGNGGNASTDGGGEDARHAISDDGTRVFFTSRGGVSHVYMRDVPIKTTLELDAGLPEAGQDPQFEDASSDGSRAFFAVASKLYECEVLEGVGGQPECKLSYLGPLKGTMLGASEDGSWVYFVSTAALASGAQSGSPNLYVRHDGVTSVVAVLSAEDVADWSTGPTVVEDVTARVSPDGHWLAFMSKRDLTGYDNRDAVSGQADEEVYLYNGATGTLVCPSCDPTGARPVGEVSGEVDRVVDSSRGWGGSTWIAASIPGYTAYTQATAVYQPRYLSDSGRLFFNSADALVPQDVNGTWDVYEYEPPNVPEGEHACTTASTAFSARSGGCISLISSGGSADPAGFLDASEDGGDVFFLTKAQLAAQDYDASLDLYDAHECTSASPCVPAPPALPPECTTADACRVPPQPQPAIFGAPSSATFSGAGNLSSASPPAGKAEAKPKSIKCKKGFVKKKGKCARRPRPKKMKKSTKGRK